MVSQVEKMIRPITSRVRKMIRPIRGDKGVFRAKIPAFYRRLHLAAPLRSFSRKKLKTSRKLEFVQRFVSLSMKKTVESRLNNSRRGKQNDT